MTIDDDIRNAVAEVWAAAERAEALIAAACPGPHAYVQHRDHKPPWCKACGRGANGVRYTEHQARLAAENTEAS